MNALGFYLANLAVQFPLLIVLIMGLFYTVTNWHRHPSASKYGTWAMVLALGVIFVDASTVHALLSVMLRTRGDGLYWLVNFLRYLVMAGAWGLMIAAAYHERPDEKAGGEGVEAAR